MSIHRRRRSSSPAAAPPLEDENLLSEILLRLPPEPSSLPRASAVCKRWRSLVSDNRFSRRFRRHHRRNPPPLLGCFGLGADGISFQPTMEPPNRVPPGRFSLQRDRLLLLGCRHGLVLLLDPLRKQALVWDPVTGVQHHIALPPRFDLEEAPINGAVLRVAEDVHFQVVLVVVRLDEGLHRQVMACVYSSETGVWGNIISTLVPSAGDFPTILSRSKPAVLVGDSLYWTLIGEFTGILEFDLERQSLAVIQLPVDMSKENYGSTVIRTEGGVLGALLLSELGCSAQLWIRKTNCDGVASWELARTIQLDKLLPLNSEETEGLVILGFAECNNVVFLWTFTSLFMVELESLQFKKLSGAHGMFSRKPFESVYAAGIFGGHGGDELLHNI